MVELFKKFELYIENRATELDAEKLYSSVLNENEFIPESVSELLQLAIFKIEILGIDFGAPPVENMVCLQQYLSLIHQEHPTRTRQLSKSELLYVIAKADSVLKHKCSIAGVKPIHKHNTSPTGRCGGGGGGDKFSMMYT